MQRINWLFTALVAVIAAGYFYATCAFAADSGDIVVHVVGLRSNSGVVRIALFNSAKTYSADKGSADKAFQKMIGHINNKESTATLENVPYGEYAIKLFHDEDNSGRFLTNAFGIPKVEYGFSNNAHGLFGPASYDKAKFDLTSKKLEMTIKMQGN